jgi:hypothetical protein
MTSCVDDVCDGLTPTKTAVFLRRLLQKTINLMTVELSNIYIPPDVPGLLRAQSLVSAGVVPPERQSGAL